MGNEKDLNDISAELHSISCELTCLQLLFQDGMEKLSTPLNSTMEEVLFAIACHIDTLSEAVNEIECRNCKAALARNGEAA